MNVIALIPARGGSKRIPGKNIKSLGGRPLICWSINTAMKLPVDGVYVSTDSKDIAQISRETGASIIDRPAELASDTATDRDVIIHALGEVDAELVVYLRPTTPFRDPQVVLNAIRFMKLNKDYSLLRSVQEMPESFFKCVVEEERGAMTFYKNYVDLPNHQCPRTFHPNGYVDICRGQWSYEQPHWYETEPVIELDTLEQWEYAEWKICTQQKKC